MVIPHFRLTIKNRLCYYSSIFDAELLALECALHQILFFDFPRAIIFLDSLSTLNSLSFPNYKGNLYFAIYIYRIKSILLSFNNSIYRLVFAGFRRIEVTKTPMLLESSPRLFPTRQMSLWQSILQLQKRCKAINIIEIEAKNKGTRCFNTVEAILASSHDMRRPGTVRLLRTVIVLVSRLRWYHVCVNTHLTKKNIISNLTSARGHENQTVNHVYFECPFFAEHSGALILDLYRIDPIVNLDISLIAFSKNTKLFSALYKFVTNF